ncbi:unnamed protein product [Protopolystoma xenopodis]|uniref:Zinc finger PHD-type domain-containing protein n=1 Tax=Protopolystoma xenopodis TaxID=117903 RepID=A0A448WG48_9PLAT|nr:unnamed protein product [Protopolystoma xenopodis]
MLVCDVCDKGFHTYCLRPPVASIPKNGFKCDRCRVCSDCGASRAALLNAAANATGLGVGIESSGCSAAPPGALSMPAFNLHSGALSGANGASSTNSSATAMIGAPGSLGNSSSGSSTSTLAANQANFAFFLCLNFDY